MSKQGKYLQELKEIQSISSKIRKMNESMMFEDEYDDDFTQMEQGMPQPQEENIPQDEPMQQGEEQMSDMKDVKPEEQGMEELDQMGEVDKIRAITLDGMKKLCNTPEHPEFQALLKIFQLCNKSIGKEETEEKQ